MKLKKDAGKRTYDGRNCNNACTLFLNAGVAGVAANQDNLENLGANTINGTYSSYIEDQNKWLKDNNAALK